MPSTRALLTTNHSLAGRSGSAFQVRYPNRLLSSTGSLAPSSILSTALLLGSILLQPLAVIACFSVARTLVGAAEPEWAQQSAYVSGRTHKGMISSTNLTALTIVNSFSLYRKRSDLNDQERSDGQKELYMKNDKTLKERVLHECPVEEEKGVVCRYFISRGLVVRASNEDRHMTLLFETRASRAMVSKGCPSPLFGLSEDSFEDRVGKRVGYSFAALKKERAVTTFNLGSSKAYLDPLLLYIRKRLPKCQIQE
ncbi:UNVERIFIED_CONTAM: hypothetical protein Sradi_6959300 [Sesamum radiatum]|uniref:Uncharacterized protein n=1 Tax=Sesamum radiatum TaxID=300843 RepID=A0AAW2JFC2_SESRA